MSTKDNILVDPCAIKLHNSRNAYTTSFIAGMC